MKPLESKSGHPSDCRKRGRSGPLKYRRRKDLASEDVEGAAVDDCCDGSTGYFKKRRRSDCLNPECKWKHFMNDCPNTSEDDNNKLLDACGAEKACSKDVKVLK